MRVHRVPQYHSPHVAADTLAGTARLGKNRAWLLRFVERNNWTCHICGMTVVVSVDSNHPLYPSRDHKVPRNYQPKGEGVPNNTRLAHRYCNSARGYVMGHGRRREQIQRRVRQLFAELEDAA